MRNGSMKMLATAASMVCALGMVAACGSRSATDAAPSATSATGSAEDYGLRFAQCLRDAGFNVSDPSADKDVRSEDVGGDPASFNEATQACEDKLGAPPGAGSDDLDDPDTLAAGVELAECLRADGYDVKDPEPGKGLALDLGVIPDSALQKCAASTTEGDK